MAGIARDAVAMALVSGWSRAREVADGRETTVQMLVVGQRNGVVGKPVPA